MAGYIILAIAANRPASHISLGWVVGGGGGGGREGGKGGREGGKGGREGGRGMGKRGDGEEGGREVNHYYSIHCKW